MEDRENTVEVEAGEVAAKAKKSRKKAGVIAGVVAGVIVVAGIGFFVWHEQPSFCNAICHQPMDPYVEGYHSDDNAILASVHERTDTNCLDCHEPTLSEQVAEGMAWLTGDFTVDEQGFIVHEGEAFDYDDATCETNGCHDYEQVIAATADWDGEAGTNPHDSHLGKLECGDCHSSHGQSTLYCDTCHSLSLPDGWAYPQA